jgi:hypothetical protein
MKNKYFILLIFIFSQFTGYSQTISVTLSSCGTVLFHTVGVDATGRNIFNDGAGSSAIKWNTVSSRWEIVVLPSTVWNANTFASSPNPPCASTGTWQTIGPGCGNVTNITGSCQTTILTDINDIAFNNNINVFPNPSNGLFNFSGLKNENSIEIFDITGRLVLHTISNESLYVIDLTEKDRGVYFYRITDKNNKKVKQGRLTAL